MKQTPKRVTGPQGMPRARFAVTTDSATPGTSGTVPSRPAAQPAKQTANDGGKQPWGGATRTPRHRRAPANPKWIPPALRIARENANTRMTGANATPQGYYKPSDTQKSLNGGQAPGP